MTKKKSKRNWKTYRIEVRTDVSFFTEVEVKAKDIYTAGEAAMNVVRHDCLTHSVPSDATLNYIEVNIEDGEEVDNG